MKLLAFPGWSGQRPLDDWCGLPVETIPHLTQWDLMRTGEKPEVPPWLPQEPWALITWSMGTWMGLCLSQCWASNPPRAWVALSPFVRMVGESCLIKAEALEVLIQSFQAKPRETLAFFCRQQGGRASWCGELEALSEADLQCFSESLVALSGAPPHLPSEKLRVPLMSVLGDRDKLVNLPMCQAFEDLFEEVHHLSLENVGHGIFYEGQPEPTKTWLASFDGENSDV